MDYIVLNVRVPFRITIFYQMLAWICPSERATSPIGGMSERDVGLGTQQRVSAFLLFSLFFIVIFFFSFFGNSIIIIYF